MKFSSRKASSPIRSGRPYRSMSCCASASAIAMSAASTMLSSSDCAVMLDALPYRTIVVADFEFEFGGHSSFDDASRSGERPRPVCMVAKDLRAGETWKVWRDELG